MHAPRPTLSAYVPGRHAVHVAAAAVVEPRGPAWPIAHLVVAVPDEGMPTHHEIVPAAVEYVPDGQRLHVAPAADVAAPGPYEPMGHGVPKHAPRPVALVKVPDGQRAQPP
jgi:hypothetical protein